MLLDLITQITQINLGQGKLQTFRVFSNFKSNNTKQADKNSPLSHRPIIHSVCPSNFAFTTFTETIMKLVFTPAPPRPAPPRPAQKNKNYINISTVVQSSQEKSKTMVTPFFFGGGGGGGGRWVNKVHRSLGENS